MASYSMELREMVEFEFGESVEEHIKRLQAYIFDFEYPFYNELNRSDFEQDFIRNYYMREIGFEAPFHFKVRLRNWLNINMPYYNELFLTEGLIKNPLVNVDWTETRITERDIISDATANQQTQSSESLKSDVKTKGESDDFNRHLETDTPDSRLQITSGENGEGVIEYASKISEDDNSTKASNESTTNGVNDSSGIADSTQNAKSNDKYTDKFHVVGTQGLKTESVMLMEFRKTFLRIKRDIYQEMNILFMLVY